MVILIDASMTLITLRFMPTGHMKMDTSIKTKSDLLSLFKSLRYWLVDTVPEDLIEFTLSPTGTNCDDIYNEFAKYFTYVSILLNITKVEPDQYINAAIKGGNIDIVKYIPKRDFEDINPASLKQACFMFLCQLACLKYFHEQGALPLDTLTVCASCINTEFLWAEIFVYLVLSEVR